jgi:hypothetical protein
MKAECLKNSGQRPTAPITMVKSCLICKESLSVLKTYKLKHHYETKYKGQSVSQRTVLLAS